MQYHHLFYSIKIANFNAVSLILRAGVDIGYINNICEKFEGPLKEAVRIEDQNIRWEMVKLLLSHRVGLEEGNNILYQQPYVHDAVRKGDSEMFKLLVEKYGGRLDCFHRKCPGEARFAPSHVAVLFLEGGVSLKMIKLLVELGADVNMKTQQNSTCMHMICGRNSHRCEVLELSLQLGAQINPPIGSIDSYHSSPLVMASFYNDCEVVKQMIEAVRCNRTPRRKDVIKVLLEHGADVDARGNDGDNYLCLATRPYYGLNANKSDKIEIIKMLMAHSADVNPVEVRNFVPFANVLCRGTVETLQLFIEKGMSPKNCGVRFPLHAASNNPPILRYLLSNFDFDVDELDDEGNTVLSIAGTACVEILIRWGADVTTPNCSDKDVKVNKLLLDALGIRRDEIADMLISVGAQVDLESSIDIESIFSHGDRYVMASYLIKQMTLVESQGHQIDSNVKSNLMKVLPNASEIVQQCSDELEALKKINISQYCLVV
ncbi:hypothetical protein QAD02_000248 [Eretmocerus hayati]|uniref:Uncharacterized protein n=1 Tax=Eretmocerus hayati TaxID=131215 RepID=A0ACC2NF79_9HYME|nr:hypothetical protein QAD02_000248 [Eretmocerus hayati]